MSIPILDFSEIKDYVAYLDDHGRRETHLDLSVIMGESDAPHGVRTVTFWAVASARFCSFDGEHLAALGIPLLSSTNVALDMERKGDPERPTRSKVQERLAQVTAELEERGLKVRPGRWLAQAPVYLR